MEEIEQRRRRFVRLFTCIIVLGILITGVIFGGPYLQDYLQENPVVVVQTKETIREVTRIVPQEVTRLVPTEVYVVVPEIYVTSEVITVTVETILRETVIVQEVVEVPVTVEVERQVPVTVEAVVTPSPEAVDAPEATPNPTPQPTAESSEPVESVEEATAENTNTEATENEGRTFESWLVNCTWAVLAVLLFWIIVGLALPSSRNRY